MKKAIIITVIFVVLAVIIGVGYWLISPLWRVVRVSEELPTANMATTTQSVTVKTGMFEGFDRVHTGSGTAKIISIDGKNYIRFEEDFTVANGPDLFVGLGKDGAYIKGSELGTLKGNEGSQNYELPAGIDVNEVQEVWIWCKAFSVGFAKAVFKE